MKKNNLLIVIIIILALLGFILYPWVILPIKNLSQNLSNPFLRIMIEMKNNTQGFFSKIISIGQIEQINNNLSQENLELKAKLAQIKELQYENKILRGELGFVKDRKQEEYLAAEVISYSPNSYIRSIKINKGYDDGVKENQAVVSSGFLVGVVSEVYKDNCDVLLIIDSTSLIPIVMQDSRATGLLQGGLTGLIAREIPLDIELKKEEMVLTSGLGGNLPQSIPVGKVKKIISAESEIFQKSQIESPIKFNNLDIVFILR